MALAYKFGNVKIVDKFNTYLFKNESFIHQNIFNKLIQNLFNQLWLSDVGLGQTPEFKFRHCQYGVTVSALYLGVL